jgi:hypothetical protein
VARYAEPDGTRFDYLSLRSSRLYERLKSGLDRLAEADNLPGDEARRIALLVNLHNAMVVEGVIDEGVTRTVRDSRRFDGRSRRLGPHDVSLRQLRYGLLGGNRRPPYSLRKPLKAGDPLLEWAPGGQGACDPRWRLVLIDATRSGPPLRAYPADPQALEVAVDATCRAFVNDTGGVMGCPGAGWYGLSPLLMWHARDFGGAAGVKEFVASHVESPMFADAIRTDSLKMRVLDYDWGLDKCVVEGPSAAQSADPDAPAAPQSQAELGVGGDGQREAADQTDARAEG